MNPDPKHFCCAPDYPGFPWKASESRHPCGDTASMTPAQTLLQAYRTGDVLRIAEAECEYMDAALAVYGDAGSLLHAEPPGYAERFAEVMDEMADIEAAAKVAA